MGVSNGEYATETTFNSSFMDREGDTDTIGKMDLKNVDAASGVNIINVQRNINALCSALGIAPNQVYDFLIAWSSTVVGLSSSSAKDKIEALVLKFRDTTLNGGHAHTGIDGDGALISAATLADYNDYWVVPQKVDILAVSGTSFDVSAAFAGKTPNGGSAAEGVLTDISNNKVELIDTTTNTFIEDAGGQKVYGRLTELAGVWTLSFYTNEAGVETAHNLTLTDISVLYREVFTSANRPTLGSNPFDFASLDLTADVADATQLQRGVVSTGVQSFGGDKTFFGFIELLSKLHLSVQTDAVATGADATLAAITKTVIEVTDIGLTSIAEIPTPTKETFLVLINKTGSTILVKNNDSLSSHILTGENGDLTVINNGRLVLVYDMGLSRWLVVARSQSLFPAAVGSTPNANGFTLTGNTFNLEPASSTLPGVLTALTQSIGGLKTFVNGVVVQTSLRSEGFAVIGGNLRMEETVNNVTTGTNAVFPHPGTAVVRLTAAALTGIDEITLPERGKILVIINDTGNSVNLNNETGATATQRILTGTGATLAVPNMASVILYYEINSTRWRVLQVSSTGGGGGSASSKVSFRINGNYGGATLPTNAFEGFDIIPDNANVTNVFMYNVVAGSGGTTEIDVKVKPFLSGAFTSIFTVTPKITAAAGANVWIGVGDTVAGATAPILGAAASGIVAKSALRADLIQKQTGSPENCGVIIFWST